MSKFIIYSDGGARGNPGPAATGFLIYQNNKLIAQKSTFIGSATNNTAEYQAVIHALTYYKKHHFNNTPISIDFYLDSNLIVNQLSGKYKIKKSHLIQLASSVHQLLHLLKATFRFHYIPRAKNHKADALVNQALDQQS